MALRFSRETKRHAAAKPIVKASFRGLSDHFAKRKPPRPAFVRYLDGNDFRRSWAGDDQNTLTPAVIVTNFMSHLRDMFLIIGREGGVVSQYVYFMNAAQLRYNFIHPPGTID